VCAARDTLQRRLGDATGALETTAASLHAARRDYESARSDIERLIPPRVRSRRRACRRVLCARHARAPAR
jgi:hypothetical protein